MAEIEEDIPKRGGEITWGRYGKGMVSERWRQKLEICGRRLSVEENLSGEIPEEDEFKNKFNTISYISWNIQFITIIYNFNTIIYIQFHEVFSFYFSKKHFDSLFHKRGL